MRQKIPSILSLLFVLGFQAGIAQSLNPGEIVLTTINENGTGNFSFLTFVDLQVGTQLYFTDRGWDTTTNDFGLSNEGTITWTATSNVEALSEIIFSNVTSGTFSVSSGTATMDGTFSMAATGDQILIYQDENPGVTNPNFIYLFNKGEPIITSSNGIRTSTIQTMIPETLILNHTAFSSDENYNNWQFDCNDHNKGNKESLLMLFMDEDNYNTNNNTSNSYDMGALSQNGCNFTLTNKDSTKPVINEQILTVREDAPIDYEIGIPVVFDLASDSFEKWEIVGGEHEELFDIDEDTGIITVKDNSTFDFEDVTTREYILEITVEDDSGNASEVDASTGNGIVKIIIEDYQSTFMVTASTTELVEGESIVLSFTNSPPSLSPIVFKLRTSGTATSGIDYETPPATIELAENQEEFTLTIATLLDNDSNEVNEIAQFLAFFHGASFNEDIFVSSGIAMTTIINNPTLSIEDTALDQNVKVYPNPGKDILHIKNSNAKVALTHGELFSLGGKLLATTPLNAVAQQQIDITMLPTGLYILKLHSNQSNTAIQITKL